jgi:Ca2+-binding RTX toxin-like protein
LRWAQTYTHEGKIEVCNSGFHAIPKDQHPLSVFSFYPPGGSRFCRVEIAGRTAREDTKIAGEILTVGQEIGLGDLAKEAVAWVMARAKPEGDVARFVNGLATASGTRGAATASGNQGAATASGTEGAATASGTRGAATASGNQGAATASGTEGAATASGYQGAATASGCQGAATASGNQGAATASGTRGAATASGYQGAATASGNQGAATASGYQGAATASGCQGAATASGNQGAATASGNQGAAMAVGPRGKVMGMTDGVDLFAREFEWTDGEWVRKSIACGTTGAKAASRLASFIAAKAANWWPAMNEWSRLGHGLTRLQALHDCNYIKGDSATELMLETAVRDATPEQLVRVISRALIDRFGTERAGKLADDMNRIAWMEARK